MRIDRIIPYERNARNNAKAIPKVAESIKEFGLRGTIGLESPDNPVIVFGHTRVEACKSLGWDEIPDSKIEYCNDLTPEQIKAFRIADNKTGDIATYNKAMLREEVRSLKDFDMSRFGLDFKSKRLPYGAERLRTDNAYNLDICNRFDCPDGFPRLHGVDVAPRELQPFNYAKSTAAEAKKELGCHFFIDDYQFERVWNKPSQYVDVLKPYQCVMTPDFSLYLDMPEPMQAWNRYRSMALGYYWQSAGLEVVPVLSWAQPESFEFAFKGTPKHSTVATSTVGVMNDDNSKDFWREGMRRAMSELEPARVLLYGSDIDFDFGGCEVVRYKAGGFHGR